MNEPKKRIGRPSKDPAPGKRASLGLKVTSEIKKKLERSAGARGRTQSQEAELRLEQSFEREELLGDVLTIAYGKTVAGLLMMLGEAMVGAGRMARIARFSDDDSNARWWRDNYDWTKDPFAYDQAVQAATQILKSAQPPGSTEPPKPDHDAPLLSKETHAKLISEIGLNEARLMVLAVQGTPRHSVLYKDEGERVRKLIGPLADRLRYPDDPVLREQAERQLAESMRRVADDMTKSRREREQTPTSPKGRRKK